MQQRILRREAYIPAVTATVGGRDVNLTSYEIERDLPDPFSSSPSFTAASGELVGIAGPEVTTTVATPWDADSQWPPVSETGVEVTMDIGQGPVTSMTRGKVLGSSGTSSSREVAVEFSDRYQSLDKTISWEPLARRMPAHDSYGWDWTRMRYVSLLSVSVTDTILRHCGWYISPPMIGYTALSVPANGTMWPESGTSLIAGRAGRGYPLWGRAPWGLVVSDFDGRYQLGGNYSIKSRGRVEMTAMTSESPDYSRISVASESNVGLFRLQWTSTQVQLFVRDPSGAYSLAVVVPRNEGFTYATIEYISDTSVNCILTSGTSRAEAVFTCSPTATTEVARYADFLIQGESNGFQVAFPSTSRSIEGWTSNVNMNQRVSNAPNLVVRPPAEGLNCLTLLKQQAEAEASTFWIDERGILQWWDLSRLEGRNPVETISAATDITDKGFTWSHEMSAVKSRVSVKWTETLTEMHPEYTITLFQGKAETVQPGAAEEPKEAWIEVPDNEIWIQPDTSLLRAGTNSMLEFNQGVGSWYGAVIPGKTDAEADRWAYDGGTGAGSFLMTLEKVSPTAFKTTLQWTGSSEVVQRTPGLESISSLWRVRRNLDLPLIRGKGKITTADRITYSTQNGPSTAPEESIDTGWWIQLPEQAQYLADYVGARVTVPQPVLSSIDTAPLPGLELGDVVEVFENKVLRATVRGILVSDRRKISVSEDKMTFDQAITVRPTHILANGVTWQEWASFIRPLAWRGWASTQAGEQWQEWGAAPLD